MASGDITKVEELGRISLPGGGNTTAGVQVQHKVLVWGKITCSWVSTGINPAAAGSIMGAGGTLAKTFAVDNIDFCELTMNDQGAGDAVDKDSLWYFALDRASDLIFGLDGLGDAARGTLPDDGDVLDLRYLVVGDASSNADLT